MARDSACDGWGCFSATVSVRLESSKPDEAVGDHGGARKWLEKALEVIKPKRGAWELLAVRVEFLGES